MNYGIVIVDDERVVREGMAAVVEAGGTGFELYGTAANGREGLVLILSKRPAFVVTDIRMPRMDGLQMIEELRRAENEVRSAIITGYDDSAYARAALRFGVRDYLLKPVLPAAFRDLLATVRRDLDREALKIGDLDALRARAEAALPAARERRVRSILEGRASSGEQDRLLGLDLTGTVFCAALLRFPAADELEHQGIAEAAAAAFGSLLDVYTASLSEDTMALLLIGRTGEAGRAFLAASGGGRRLREATEARLGEPVTFALGGLKLAKEDLPASYAEARETLASVFGAGEGGLVAFGDIASRESQEATRGAADAAAEAADAVAVVAAVKLGSPAGAEAAARDFVASLSGRKASEERVKSKVVACLAAIDSSFPSETERPSPPLVAAAAASNLGELAELAALYASSCAVAVERSRAGRAADLVERARIIVERRMADEELSLDDVAAELFVSPSHLRHVFKKQAGTTFCDYLCALRLDAAARLLDDRDLKIQDIAARVGYAEQRYFASCFKKRFGMTPTERRDAYRASEKE